MTKKKNRFWTFCFSFIPGAGEMYMGFMKMGISLMSLFVLVFFLAISLNMGALLCIDVVVWFYGFFHVHSLKAMDDEDFYALEDQYLFQNANLDLDFNLFSKGMVKKYQKIIGAGLVIWGISILWKNLWSQIAFLFPQVLQDIIQGYTYRLPQMVIAVVIIWAGVTMVRGKKQELYEETEEAFIEECEDEIKD